MEIYENIIEVLKEKVDERDLKYKDLAENSGFKQSYISKIFNGNVKKIGLETLEKLLSALDITLSDFFVDVEKKTPQPT